MRPVTRQLEQFLADYPPDVRALALRARELILKALPDAVETVWPGWRIVGYGTGPGMPEMVYGIGPLKSRINLTFARGTLLDDAHGLLKGTSKTSRHLHVTTIEELESLPVRGLIKQALAIHADIADEMVPRARGAGARSARPPAKRAAQQDSGARTRDEPAPVSDVTVKEKTGKSWNEWFRLLDRVDAHAMTHGEIVRVLADTYEVGPWWRQMLAVGYERARGLREKHETPSGYQVGASKTVNVPVAELWTAWHDARRRRAWLGDAQLTIRKATAPKSLRITWSDGSSVDVLFQAKSAAKSMVSVDHRKLPDGERVAEMKSFWRERLVRLKQKLEG
jgi:uncharacterized protein YndB with AHSA1/START domain